MNKRYIIYSLLPALLITGAILLQALHFRYYSNSYNLMKISKAIIDNNIEDLSKICDVNAFTDSFQVKIMPLIKHNPIFKTDTNLINQLNEYHINNQPFMYIMTVYTCLQGTEGNMTGQNEKRVKEIGRAHV